MNSKVPYSGCKAEEEGEGAQPHQQPTFPTRKELQMKEESVCTIHGVEWLFWISSSLSPPFFFAFGYYRLATLGPTLDLFENNTTKVAFIQSKLLCPSTNDSLWKERNAGNKSFLSTGSWKLSIPASPILILPLASVLHQIMSPCANFLFYWRPIGRLLDWVESLPTHKGSDSSESPNGGGENILIESSTVLNSEKDFFKFDQIDR